MAPAREGWNTGNSSVKITISNCEYRGEGNANIVIRLIQEQKVLRLVKNAFSEGVTDSTLHNEERLKIYRDFVKNVMQALLGNFVVDPVIIPISADEVIIVNQVLEGKRPANRLDRWLQESSTLGVLLPDFCELPPRLSSLCPSSKPVLAVEIKPKQGFLSKAYRCSSTNMPKPNVCRFCLKQRLKLKTKCVERKSGYCPLDLFSGCPVRMTRALRELLKNPQNNIVIFKEQKVIFDVHSKEAAGTVLGHFFETKCSESAEDQLVHLVVEALLVEFEDDFQNPLCNTAQTDSTNLFCDNVPKVTCVATDRCPHRLPEGCVLNRILQVQQLGQSDVDFVYPFYKNSLEESDMHLEGLYPKCHPPSNMGLIDQHPLETKEQFQSRKIWEFLVSMTARDCSIMLVFQQLDNCESVPVDHIIRDSCGNPFLTSAAVVDLDPKSVKRIQGIFQCDKELAEDHFRDTTRI